MALLAVNNLQNALKRDIFFCLKVEKGKEHPKVALKVKAAAEDLPQILSTHPEQDRVRFRVQYSYKCRFPVYLLVFSTF
jgi:hypothetical protein